MMRNRVLILLEVSISVAVAGLKDGIGISAVLYFVYAKRIR